MDVRVDARHELGERGPLIQAVVRVRLAVGDAKVAVLAVVLADRSLLRILGVELYLLGGILHELDDYQLRQHPEVRVSKQGFVLVQRFNEHVCVSKPLIVPLVGVRRSAKFKIVMV
jgi:hypothetical protein